jgi:hypothetical protein
MGDSLQVQKNHAALERLQRFISEAEAASLYGGKAEGLRGIRSGRRSLPDKTPLCKGIHWQHLGKGRKPRYDRVWFDWWLLESKEVHQRRIDEFLVGTSSAPVEGVRAVGRPRKEVSTK